MQIFHAFLFNVKSYSPEVITIQRREAEFFSNTELRNF